jgi:small subunit ribosomal protein S9
MNPRHEKVEAEVIAEAVAPTEAVVVETTEIKIGKPTISGGRYVFATGRRKTAIANVRLFSGKGKSTINKKPVEQYFGHAIYRDELMKPLELTGLAGDFYFTASINGGGIHAQSQALRHGLAQALAGLNEEIKKVLKKNTFLTRDDRKKERKKPGLKRARRSPQWAKR